MPFAGALRQELSVRNRQIASATGAAHELTNGEVPSVIFRRSGTGHHGNFHPTSFRNICANPQWLGRLTKIHTSGRKVVAGTSWRWRELDCANSSDALLMNVFCYRQVLRDRAICGVLGVAPGHSPEFGFKPRIPLRDGKTDRTEIDLRLGDLLVEAKLTETDFQVAPVRLIDRYRDIDDVFDRQILRSTEGVVRSYQLIRGVLAAHATGGSFCVLCDDRRPDLVEDSYTVMRAVRNCDLRCRLQLLTWRELARVLPRTLQRFLATKYGIVAPAG